MRIIVIILITIGVLFFFNTPSLVINASKNNFDSANEEIQSKNEELNISYHRIFSEFKEICDSFFQKRLMSRNFNGALLIGYKDSVVFESYRGYANFQKKEIINKETLFELASASKPITATAILILYEKGALSIYDSVKKFFPEFPYPDITIFHLLTHRSGLPEYFYLFDNYLSDKKRYLNNPYFIEFFNKNKFPTYSKPNQKFKYCNTNYALLASIVEKVTEKNFKVFIKEEIFSKIGTDKICFFDEVIQDTFPKKIMGYYRNWREYVPLYLNGIYGDKGIYLTAKDMFKFLRALDKGLLISDSLKHLAWNENFNEIKNCHSYGLGWRIYYYGSDKIIYHTGKWNGFKSLAIIFPGYETYAVFLSNNYRSHGFGVEDFYYLLNIAVKNINLIQNLSDEKKNDFEEIIY